MKKSKLDRPQTQKEVIKRLATGESQSSIARDVGVDRSQVSRFAGREDIKPFLEQELMNLLEAVPDAVENIKQLVRGMKNIPLKDAKRRELAYKASSDTLRAGGIMASPVQSQVITNIYQQNNHFQSPLVQEIIRKHSELLLNWRPEGWTEEDNNAMMQRIWGIMYVSVTHTSGRKLRSSLTGLMLSPPYLVLERKTAFR